MNVSRFLYWSLNPNTKYSLKSLALSTGSLNNILTKTFTDYKDFSNLKYISFDIYASRTGQNITISIHNTSGTTTSYNVTVNSANTWETKLIDISSVADADKNSIDKLSITVLNADADNTFYIDNVYGYINQETSIPFII